MQVWRMVRLWVKSAGIKTDLNNRQNGHVFLIWLLYKQDFTRFLLSCSLVQIVMHTSVSFTEAKCNFKKVGTGGTPYLIDFDDIFSIGIDLLFDMKSGTLVLNEDEHRAVDILYDFIEEKGKC